MTPNLVTQPSLVHVSLTSVPRPAIPALRPPFSANSRVFVSGLLISCCWFDAWRNIFWEVRDEGVVAPRSSSTRTQKRGTSAHSLSHDATSATQVSGIFASSCTNSKRTHALPETFKELKTRSTLLVSFAIPVHVSHHNPFLTVAAHPRWRKAQMLQQTQHTAKPLSCLFVCHPHLTSIIALTAVWAQPCGLEHKTSLSFSCIFASFSSAIAFLFVLCRLVAHRQGLCTTSVSSCFSLPSTLWCSVLCARFQ